jgi:hypothetical protein
MVTHRRAHPAGVILSSLLALLAAGCSEELGPEQMPVSRVKGVVTEGGRPLSRGWIEFFPVDGTVGKLRSARLASDGSFEADKVPVGRSLIRLVNADIETPRADRLFAAFHSPIRRTVPAQPGPLMKIDLLDEWVRFVEPRPRLGAGAAAPGDAR